MPKFAYSPIVSEIIAELTRQIAARRQVYDRAFDGDFAMLAKIHGDAIADALRMLERQRKQRKCKRRRTDDSTRQHWLESRMPMRGWPRLTT